MMKGCAACYIILLKGCEGRDVMSLRVSADCDAFISFSVSAGCDVVISFSGYDTCDVISLRDFARGDVISLSC